MTKHQIARAMALAFAGWLGAGTWAYAQTQDNRLTYELLNRLDLLEREVRQLRGEVEMLRYQQEQGGSSGDLDRRLRALESTVGRAGAGGAPVYQEPPEPAASQRDLGAAPDEPRGAAVVTPRIAPPPSSPPGAASTASPETYDSAYQLLREGRYEQAKAGFQQYLARYPDSPRAGDAQYWLGEVHYITRDFQKAKEAFLTLGSSYPSSDKLPDAMLRLGYTYQELGDRSKARQVLQQLIDLYPTSQAAQLAERRLGSLR